MWEEFALTRRSRDTAHARWLRTHCEWYPTGDVTTHVCNVANYSRHQVTPLNCASGGEVCDRRLPCYRYNDIWDYTVDIHGPRTQAVFTGVKSIGRKTGCLYRCQKCTRTDGPH